MRQILERAFHTFLLSSPGVLLLFWVRPLPLSIRIAGTVACVLAVVFAHAVEFLAYSPDRFGTRAFAEADAKKRKDDAPPILGVLHASGQVDSRPLRTATLVFAEPHQGDGMPIEMFVRGDRITWLALADAFAFDVGDSSAAQHEAEALIRAIVDGGAVRYRQHRRSWLACGRTHVDEADGVEVERVWASWRSASQPEARLLALPG